MKIIAGKWRGRPLTAPEGTGTRPTSARAREALFSMLTSRLGSFEGLRVVDLFAGTGALGLEALSRGAAHCTFVETAPAALRLLKQNVETLGAEATILPRDARRPGPAPAPCDLAFLDAPYDQGLTAPALAALLENNWLAPKALIAAETSNGETIDANALNPVAKKSYGKAKITILEAT